MLNNITPIVKNLLIINILVFVAFTYFFPDWNQYVEGYYPTSSEFLPVQLVSHMFMHANLPHLFFNMFALFMFGSVLEHYWGPRFFLLFYFVSGFGAIALHMLVKYISIRMLSEGVSPEVLQQIYNEGRSVLMEGKNYADPAMAKINLEANIPAVGASGAVYGLLAGFGLQFPRHKLMLLFPPIPIEARFFIPILIVIEFFAGFSGGSNIAHFAHIGGALFGFLMLKFRYKLNI